MSPDDVNVPALTLTLSLRLGSVSYAEDRARYWGVPSANADARRVMLIVHRAGFEELSPRLLKVESLGGNEGLEPLFGPLKGTPLKLSV